MLTLLREGFGGMNSIKILRWASSSEWMRERETERGVYMYMSCPVVDSVSSFKIVLQHITKAGKMHMYLCSLITTHLWGTVLQT